MSRADQAHVEVSGPNGFWQALDAWDTDHVTLNTSQGPMVQGGTYSASGYVVWKACVEGYVIPGMYYECYTEAALIEPTGTAQASVTPLVAPTVISVTPSSGSGSVQTFTAVYSSTAGAGDIAEAWLWINPTLTNNGNTCMVRYIASSHAMALLHDNGSDWMSAPVGSGPPPQNSRCLLNTLASTASASGNTLTVTFSVLFQPVYAGAKNLYMFAFGQSGASSGWHDKGDWTVTCPATITPGNTTIPASSGELTFFIAIDQGCGWTAPATSGFLTLTSAGSGTGPGQVSYSFTANASTNPRSTQPAIAGQVVTVTQIGTNQSLPDEEISYYHLDAIGSVRMVTDANGATLRRHDFLPFGQEVAGGPPPEAVMFTGQERDPETPFDYFEARHYFPEVERFATVDPGFAGASLPDPQSWNGYAYARNNPLKYVDPDGRAYLICNLPGDCGNRDVPDSEFDKLAESLPAGTRLEQLPPELGLARGFIVINDVRTGYYEQLYRDVPVALCSEPAALDSCSDPATIAVVPAYIPIEPPSLERSNRIRTIGGLLGGYLVNRFAERLSCGPIKGTLHTVSAGLELFGAYHAAAWTVSGAVTLVTTSPTVVGGITGGTMTFAGAYLFYTGSVATVEHANEAIRNFSGCRPR